MKTQIDLHPIQAEILRVLLFRPVGSFSDLNTWGIATNQFAFHVNALIDAGLLLKEVVGYSLTSEGKEFSNRLDTDISEVERQAKITVQVCCMKEEEGSRWYLIQQRLKHPFFGYYGFFGGKIKWGEQAIEAAARELEEETGLTADFEFLRIHHKRDYTPDGKLLEDGFFYSFVATNLRGELIEEFEGGRNIWMRREDIAQLPDFFHVSQVSLDCIEKGTTLFMEQDHIIERY